MLVPLNLITGAVTKGIITVGVILDDGSPFVRMVFDLLNWLL